ncbi:MAG: pilus assembly protein [Proteobacteria bacterium]|nr:pilus assembly protein [Pseudomonadota bacterium]
MNDLRRSPSARSSQQGAALMVVLVLLVIMTLLGLASLRGALMGQRMSANTYDRNLSFQGAEAALREGEAVLATAPAATAFQNGCPSGLCSQPTATSGTPDRWMNPSFAGWFSVTDPVLLGALPSAAGTPQYFIEYMGLAPNWPGCDQEIPMHPNCLTPRYRVTARNANPALAGDRAMVVLQTNYVAANP